MRSKWKGFYVDPFLKERIKKTKKLIRVFSRGSTILPEYLDKTFSIYNGKSFTKIKITKEMFFKKFGEYSITKAIGHLIHTTKKKKKKKKIKMGHIVNPLGKRLGFVRFWNSDFTSQTNKVEENKIYPYYTSIVKINNSFFKKKYLKRTGLLKFGEKILFEKNKIKNIIYLQDFKLEQTEWDFCQELQNASKVEGKVCGEVRRLSKLGENVKHLIYVSVREQNRRDRLKNLKKEKQSAQKFVNILNVGIVMLCCYWLVLKALLTKAFEIKGYKNMEINFLIWQEPEKIEFIDREAAYQEYIKAGGKRIGPFQYTKPPREEIFLTPKFIGEYITNKLKQKHLLKDVLKPLIKKLGRHKGVKGFKITCSGRFSRAERATYKWQKRGKLPLNNLKEFIEYDYSEATLRFGQVGIKVWLCYNKKNLKDLWEKSNKII